MKSLYYKRLLSVLLVIGIVWAVTPLKHPDLSDSRPGSELQTSRLSNINSYSELPLSFEANGGQANPSVKYLARGNGYTLSVAPTEASLQLPVDSDPLNRTIDSVRLTLKLVGANPGVRPRGVNELTGKLLHRK
jgi:hypothetical protein